MKHDFKKCKNFNMLNQVNFGLVIVSKFNNGIIRQVLA